MKLPKVMVGYMLVMIWGENTGTNYRAGIQQWRFASDSNVFSGFQCVGDFEVRSSRSFRQGLPHDQLNGAKIADRVSDVWTF